MFLTHLTDKGSACGLAINTTCEPSKIFACILECPVNWFTEYILKCLLFKSLWMCQSGFTIAVRRVFFYNSIVQCAKVLCYLYRFCYHWPCSQGMCRSVAKDCLKCWQHSMKCTEHVSKLNSSDYTQLSSDVLNLLIFTYFCLRQSLSQGRLEK